MAELVKVFVAKPDNLNLISRTHKMLAPESVLWFPYSNHCMGVHARAPPHKLIDK